MLSIKKYYTYQIDKYIYEIEVNDKLTEIWMYKENYGIKQHVIGIPKKYEEINIIQYIKEEHERNSWIYKCDCED